MKITRKDREELEFFLARVMIGKNQTPQETANALVIVIKILLGGK